MSKLGLSPESRTQAQNLDRSVAKRKRRGRSRPPFIQRLTKEGIGRIAAEEAEQFDFDSSLPSTEPGSPLPQRLNHSFKMNNDSASGSNNAADDNTNPGLSDDTDVVSPPPLDDQIPESGTSEYASGAQWLDTKCVFCNVEVRECNEPKLLPCLHTACKSCLNSEVSANSASPQPVPVPGAAPKQLNCPVCSQDFVVDDAIDHLFLLEHLTAQASSEGGIQEESKSYPCTSCEENNDATGFCNDCQEWLCETCVSAHHRVRVTKDHVIRPKEEMEGEKPVGLSQKYLFCPSHSHEPLKVYCESCDKLTCRDCQLTDHKNHKYQFLQKACEEERNNINLILDKIKEKQNHIKVACDLVNRRHGEISQREQVVSQEIKKFAVRFISEINKRGKQLLQELADVCSNKKSQLSGKNQELVNVGEQLEYCLKFADTALASGSETALVYSRKIIYNQLRKIVKHGCEVPNPQHTVDIVFSYETNFLSQYISSLGSLMVDQVPVPQPNTQQVLHPNAAMMAVAKPNPVATPTVNHVGSAQPQMMRSMIHSVPRMPQVRQKQPQVGLYGQPQVTSSTDPAQNRQQNIPKQLPNQPMQQVRMQRMVVPTNQNQNFNVSSNTSFIGQRQVLPHPSPGRPQNSQQMTPQRQQPAQVIPQRQQQQQPAQVIPQRQQQQQPAQVIPQRQQQQQPAPAPPVQQPQQTYQQNSQVPASLMGNSNITISPIGGPTPPKQRALAGRQSNQMASMTPVSSHNNASKVQRQPEQRSNAPQLIVIDAPRGKTPNMNNTARLTHFPASASIPNLPSSLQIQPINFPSNNGASQHLGSVQSQKTTPKYHSQLTIEKLGEKESPTNTANIKDKGRDSNASQKNLPPLDKTGINKQSKGSSEQYKQKSSICIEQLICPKKKIHKILQEETPMDTNNYYPSRRKSSNTVIEESMSQSSLHQVSSAVIEALVCDIALAASSNLKKSSPSTPIDSNIQTLSASSSSDNKLQEQVPEVGESQIAGICVVTEEFAKESGKIEKNKKRNLRPRASLNPGDNHEDYCAACHDGGDLLMCGNCPRVFHLTCHIPSLTALPKDDWICRLCEEMQDRPLPSEAHSSKTKRHTGICGRDLVACQKILLELYCHENSLPFHIRVCKSTPRYYEMITNPTDLSKIRMKLSSNNFKSFSTVEDFVSEFKLMIKNCYTYNEKNSPIFYAAKNLDAFFNDRYQVYFPNSVKQVPVVIKKGNKTSNTEGSSNVDSLSDKMLFMSSKTYDKKLHNEKSESPTVGDSNSKRTKV